MKRIQQARPASRRRSRAIENALKRQSRRPASRAALSRHAKSVKAARARRERLWP